MIKSLVIAAGVTLLGAGAVAAAELEMLQSVSSLTVEAIENEAVMDGDGMYENGGPNGMSPVPLPAAGWMLLAGIGGIVALRRRAKA
jgi:hypothetical protein